MIAALGVTFAVCLAAVLWISSGAAGLLYLPLYALAVLPGLPLGFALFGRRHGAGWIAGALLGYGLTQLTLWAVIVSGYASGLLAVAAWAGLCGLTVTVARAAGPRPAIDMPSWTRVDTHALLLVLLLVPALMGPPYANLGRADAQGNRYYRAYFTADFVWHTALAYELGKFSLPPRNPYMAPKAMNYYWTYFLLPATVAEDRRSSVPSQRRGVPESERRALRRADDRGAVPAGQHSRATPGAGGRRGRAGRARCECRGGV